MKNRKNQKGFTLIELLVVIAIIAVLSVVVILTLNPAELLRQARDSNRVSDLATMKSALSLFEADVNTSSVNAIGTYAILYTGSVQASTSTTAYTGAGAWGFATTSVTSVTINASRAINGGGWVPANFSLISSGSPIGNEPVDPTNDNTDYYVYVASSTTFKFGAKVESTKYGPSGGGNIVTTDGGNSITTFESGTNLGL